TSLCESEPGFSAASGAFGATEANTDYFRDARLLHGDTVDHVGGDHHAFGVSDDDELRLLSHGAQHVSETADVGFVERGVDFVQHAEGAGLEEEDADEEGERGEGFLATRE